MTWNPPPMPTREELAARSWLVGDFREALLAMHAHGINPDNIPASSDAVTLDGYLQALGFDGDRVITERVPWQRHGIDPTEARRILQLILNGPRP